LRFDHIKNISESIFHFMLVDFMPFDYMLCDYMLCASTVSLIHSRGKNTIKGQSAKYGKCSIQTEIVYNLEERLIEEAFANFR